MNQEKNRKSILLNVLVIVYMIIAMIASGILFLGLGSCMKDYKFVEYFCSLKFLLPPNVPLIISLFFIKKLWIPIRFLTLAWLSFILLFSFNAVFSLIIASILSIGFVATLLEFMTPNNSKVK